MQKWRIATCKRYITEQKNNIIDRNMYESNIGEKYTKDYKTGNEIRVKKYLVMMRVKKELKLKLYL